jgi:thioredoxin reductase
MSWLAEVAKTLKYSPDQPRDDHGRFGEGNAAPLFERLMKPDGGFTVNMLDGSEVAIGTPKYAVSMPGNEAALKADDVKSPLDIYKYIQAHQEALATPGNFFGGWHDPASHTLYLDVSRVVDTPEAAAQAARENHQIAYFDFKQGQSVTVDEGAHHGKTAQRAHARHEEGERGQDRGVDDRLVQSAQRPRTQQGGRRRAARAGQGGPVDAALTVATLLKFDESQHPRDEMGRFADDGGPAGDDSTDTGTTELSAAQLQHQADDAIKNIEKHLDVAVASADYSNVPGMPGSDDDEPETPDPVWDDYNQDAKDAAAQAYFEDSDSSSYYTDAYDEAKNDVIREMAKDNDDYLAAADEAVVDAAKDSPLFTEQAELFGETLHLQLDKETILSNGDADGKDAPALDLDALRTVSGKELTPEQRDFVEREWTNAYEQAFKDELESDKVEERISEAAREAESEAKDNEWSNMSDSSKMDWIPSENKGDYDIDYDNHPHEEPPPEPASPGLPDHWLATYDGDQLSGSNAAAKQKEDYQRTSAIAQKLVELRTTELLKERGLVDKGIGGRADQITNEITGAVWDSWKSDSHANVAMAMQLATAQEFDGLHRLTPEQETHARETAGDDFGAYGAGAMDYAKMSAQQASERGLKVLQAYTRAQWETSQFVLTKAGVQNMQLYRGLMLDGNKIGPVENADVTTQLPSAGHYAVHDTYAKLSQMQMQQRGALQSTSLSLGVANGWNGVGSREGNTHVTVRLDVPKTSIFSLPVFGKNVPHEQEVVVAGFKDHWKWDAWKGHAPDLSKYPIKMAKKRKAAQPYVIDLGQIEISHPYWLADRKGKWARIPMHKALDTLTGVLKYSPDQPRDDHGRFGEGDSGPGADHAESGSHVGGVVPGDREKFRALKNDWARVNNQLLAYVDTPNSPAAIQKMGELKDIVKEMYTLRADPGGLEGIGLPGGPRDIVVVGAGPGGLAASVMGGTDGLDTLVIDGNTTPGGQSKYSSRIENYPGFPIGVTGEQLSKQMYEQAQRVGAESKLGVRVESLSYNEATGMKTLKLSNGESVEARAVIIAGGVEFRKMDFEGSDSPSVVYADAKTLAKEGAGHDVVVLGGSNGAAQAALGAALTANHVAVLSRSPIEKGMSDYQVSALRNNPKISIFEGTEVHKLICDDHKRAQQLVTNTGKTLDCHVLGVFIGGGPSTKWLPDSVKRSDSGKIHVDANLHTSMPGVFAVGDVRHGGIGRIGAAVGDGQIAEKNVFDYFNTLQSKRGQH